MRTMCAVLLAATCFAAPGVSQQPTRRQMDSLAAQVRQLRARLDSVLAALARRPAPSPPAAPVGDDLAALRAAASQAAGGGLSDSTRGADTLTQAMGREPLRMRPMLSLFISNFSIELLHNPTSASGAA